MALDLGELRVKLGVDMAGLEKGMSAAQKSLQDFGMKAQMAGMSMTQALTLPLTLLGGTAIKAAVDFESSFAGIRKTVQATEAQFDSLRKDIRETAKTLPVAATELAKIGEAAGQLGIKTENILEFTKTMAALGVSTNLSAEMAASSLARLANITGMSQKDFGKLGSAIVELGNNFATTEQEIVAMGLRIAGAGKQIGLSEPQILGFAAALSSVGIEAEAGGTAISRTFIKIAGEVRGGGENLEAFAKVAGMSVVEFKTAFETDAAGAIVSFIEGLGKISKAGGNVFGVLELLELNEIRVRDALLRASGAGDLFRSAIEMGSKAYVANIALTREAEQRYGTTASQLIMLKNRANDVAITIGDSLKTALLNTAQSFLPLLSKIENAAKWFAGLDKSTQTVVFQIGGLIALLGPALLLLGALAGSVAFLTPIVTGLGAALTFLALNPIGLTITAVATLGYGLYQLAQNNGQVKDTLLSAWNEMSSAGTRIFANMADAGRSWIRALETVTDTAISLTHAIGKAFDEMIGNLGTSGRILGGIFKPATDLLQGNWETAWKEIVRIADAMFSQVVNIFGTGAKVVGGNFQLLTDLLRGDWDAAWKDIKGLTETATNFVVDSVANLVKLLSGDWQQILDTARGAFTALKAVMVDLADFVATWAKKISAGIASAFGSAKTYVMQALEDNVLAPLRDLLNKPELAEVKEQGLVIIKKISDGFASGKQALSNTVGNTVQAASDAVSGQLESWRRTGEKLRLELERGLRGQVKMLDIDPEIESLNTLAAEAKKTAYDIEQDLQNAFDKVSNAMMVGGKAKAGGSAPDLSGLGGGKKAEEYLDTFTEAFGRAQDDMLKDYRRGQEDQLASLKEGLDKQRQEQERGLAQQRADYERELDGKNIVFRQKQEDARRDKQDALDKERRDFAEAQRKDKEIYKEGLDEQLRLFKDGQQERRDAEKADSLRKLAEIDAGLKGELEKFKAQEQAIKKVQESEEQRKRQKDLVNRIRDAQEGLADAQRQGLEKVTDAQQKLTEAQKKGDTKALIEAQKDLAEAYQDRDRALRNTQERLNEALEEQKRYQVEITRKAELDRIRVEMDAAEERAKNNKKAEEERYKDQQKATDRSLALDLDAEQKRLKELERQNDLKLAADQRRHEAVLRLDMENFQRRQENNQYNFQLGLEGLRKAKDDELKAVAEGMEKIRAEEVKRLQRAQEDNGERYKRQLEDYKIRLAKQLDAQKEFTKDYNNEINQLKAVEPPKSNIQSFLDDTLAKTTDFVNKYNAQVGRMAVPVPGGAAGTMGAGTPPSNAVPAIPPGMLPGPVPGSYIPFEGGPVFFPPGVQPPPGYYNNVPYQPPVGPVPGTPVPQTAPTQPGGAPFTPESFGYTTAGLGNNGLNFGSFYDNVRGGVRGGRAPATAQETQTLQNALQAFQQASGGMPSNPGFVTNLPPGYSSPYQRGQVLSGGPFNEGETVTGFQAAYNEQGGLVGYQAQTVSPAGTLGEIAGQITIHGGIPAGISEGDFREVMGLSVSSQPLSADRVEAVRDALEKAGIDVPQNANGGIATKATFGIFGEAGPEAIMPLARLGDMLSGFAARVTDNIMQLMAPTMPKLTFAGETGGSETPVHVHIELGGRELDSVVLHGLQTLSRRGAVVKTVFPGVT